ncbi:hypothetical protein PZA11_002007 [Diplocarpon coronariae]|nr:hypothetical protein JHW43_007756 [Diplocarpon mali]
MRLINTATIELESFLGKPPPYAVLSHRWEANEVSFEEMKPGGIRDTQKLSKIHSSCAIASRHGLEFLWIDTCCIDKASSSELSEAINSMFRYYKEAEICYTYLCDVGSVQLTLPVDPRSDFCQSVWFSRGWTLQELIAPKQMRFYNRDWAYIGSKAGLKDAICSVTKIPESFLLGGDLTRESVSRKMSWVSSRQTTVPEDIAYCLLGLFDVNIPLLYGEGEEKAFLRIQEAILKHTDDNSIFLWRSTQREAISIPAWGMLAKSPTYFSRSPGIQGPCSTTMATNTSATLTGRGVNVEFLMGPISIDNSESIYAAIIFAEGGRRSYAPLLKKLTHSGGEFVRVGADILLEIDKNMGAKYSKLPQRLRTNQLWRNNELKEPQALRFYARQNANLLSKIPKEAVGLCFDSRKSLPQGISVTDWSSRWNRWDGGRFTGAGTTYLLEFEPDHPFRFQPPPTIKFREGSSWESEILGVILLSHDADHPDDSNRRKPPRIVALCAGIQHSAEDCLKTELLYHRPWCHPLGISGGDTNPDQIYKDYLSIRDSYVLPYDYTVSFSLQVCYGQVYYLIKLSVEENVFDKAHRALSSHTQAGFSLGLRGKRS